MTEHEHDGGAHWKAAEKITFEKELCGDLIARHLRGVPEELRPYVRITLEGMLVELRKLWRPHLKNEWERDRGALLGLIGAVFLRWGKGDFERCLVLHQLAINPKNKPKEMSAYLDGRGIGVGAAAARARTQRQVAARRGADRKELSRGSKPYRVPEKKRIAKDPGEVAYLTYSLQQGSCQEPRKAGV
jgi:hypothetical protein